MLFSFNPIDAIFQANKSMPNSLKEHLVTSNPRPAGLLFRSVLTPIKPWPWLDLSDHEFNQEMRHNNGLLICVFLRTKEFGNDSSFLRIFRDAENEYEAALKKAKWSLAYFSNPKNKLDKILSGLEGELLIVEDNFVEWAGNNRSRVLKIITDILANDEYRNGNVYQDLERWQPNWYATKE